MNIRYALLMLALVAFPALAAAEATNPARELRICVDPDNPPLSLNGMGAQPGIDVEIGQAIAARLDRQPRLVWVDTTYGGRALRRSLLAGQCELFMGLPVDPAAETTGALATTSPYYSTGYRLIRTHDGSNEAPAAMDLRQLRIAVERQSGAQMRLERIGSHLVVYGNQREVLDAVAHGDVDAGAVWLPDVGRLLQGRALATAAADAAPDRLLQWNMAMGVRRADADLRTSVNRAIADLLAEGRIEAIFDRYRLPFFPPFTDH
jgi:ABC-type amino acid transport/signal transduction systems, periplasmic component/domain